MKFSVETKHILDDLKALADFDINAYGRVAALIRELNANQGTPTGQMLIDQLNIQGGNIAVGPQMVGNCLLIENERIQRNLWRLKLWRIDSRGRKHLEPYRLIYGFFPASQFRKIPEIRVFAVPCRARGNDNSYDYDRNDPLSIRIRSDYDAYE